MVHPAIAWLLLLWCFEYKIVFLDGGIREMVIWRLPAPDAERPHGLKYSLYFGRSGERLSGYGNERGKGDHGHYGLHEEKYDFSTVEKLMAAFEADLTAKRLELLRALRKRGPLSVRTLSKNLGRDYKNVHADAAVLESVDLIQRNEEGLIIAPWDVIDAHVRLVA